MKDFVQFYVHFDNVFSEVQNDVDLVHWIVFI